MWAAGLQIAGSVLPILSYMLWKAYFSGFSFTAARFFGFIFSVPMMPSLVLEASTWLRFSILMQFSKLVPSSEHCRASLVRRRPNGAVSRHISSAMATAVSSTSSSATTRLAKPHS